MTGHRFRIYCPDVCRIRSRETFKSWFSWFLDFLESHLITDCLQNGPWRSSVVPGCSLGPPKMKLENQQMHKTKSKNLENLEIRRGARRNIIEICLVKILSTSMACHLVTNRMHHEYSWCIRSIHDASWVLRMHHEHPWVFMLHHGCIMSTHDVHHE